MLRTGRRAVHARVYGKAPAVTPLSDGPCTLWYTSVIQRDEWRVSCKHVRSTSAEFPLMPVTVGPWCCRGMKTEMKCATADCCHLSATMTGTHGRHRGRRGGSLE